MILQKIVENKREEVARQKEILPLTELRQMLRRQAPTRDFRRGDPAPGLRGDRRGQAELTVKGPDPGGL